MDSKISVLWWNVHNLRNETHAARVVAKVKESNPDIFCLGEVVGEAAYRLVAKEFPEHNFYMTHGKQAQEMLIGVHRKNQVFFSQRTEFQSGNEFLRPAALITINCGEQPLNLLFVHLKSFQDPISLGYRDQFIKRLGRLKKTLDNLSSGNSKFIICGDLNLQGMDYLIPDQISANDEVLNVQKELGTIGLSFAEPKNKVTWSTPNGNLEAVLDYVAVTTNLQMTNFGSETNPMHLNVRGWPEYPQGAKERTEFIETVSDHALLLFTIEI